ncbi:hypothetical protein Tco_0161745 [Tanacetum coccineum]
MVWIAPQNVTSFPTFEEGVAYIYPPISFLITHTFALITSATLFLFESVKVRAILRFYLLALFIYTSVLTSGESKDAIAEYWWFFLRYDVGALTLTLPSPCSEFFYKLCKQGHLFSFENKTGGRSRKCFKEVTSSFKGWKKKIFLINRRAIPDAMPWRHTDTDLCYDFPAHYSESDDARLAEFVVPLHPPPRHLLYMCGLTTTCQHPELAYIIKDRDGNVITMDAFLKLLIWTGTVVSKYIRTTPPLAIGETIPEKSPFQKNLEKPNSKIVAVREKKDQHNLVKLQAKRAGEGISDAPQKKRKVCKNQEPNGSGSEKTLSPTPLHHVSPENVKEPATVNPNGLTGDATHVKKKVVDLSGNTRASTSPATVIQPSPWPKLTTSDAHSFHSFHHEDTEDGPADRRFVPNWGLHDDLRICTLKDMEKERDDWRRTASDQVEKIKSLKKTLAPKSRQLITAEERVRVLEGEKAALEAGLARAEVDRQKLVRGFILVVVQRLHTSVEYWKSLAAPDLDIEGSKSWEAKHRELFTMQYPYIQMVADSYRLPMDDLMKVSPDAPPPLPPANEVGTSTTNGTDGVAQRSLPPVQETTAETPFDTTT